MRAMWAGLLWFVLLSSGFALLPAPAANSRRVVDHARILSLLNNPERYAESWFGPTGGLFMIGLGVRYLIKYRSPDVRAKHIEYWTAKA